MSLDQFDKPTGEFTTVIPPGVEAIQLGMKSHFGIERAEVRRAKSRCDVKRSEHCECGAIDIFPPNKDFVLGRRMFDFFVANEEALGIQSVIWDHRQIGFGNPTERDYADSDHEDHVHVGISRSARQTVTRAMVDECLAMEEFRMFTEAELANLKELAALPSASLSKLAALPSAEIARLGRLAALPSAEISRLVKLAGDFSLKELTRLNSLVAFMIAEGLTGEETGRPAVWYDALRRELGVPRASPDDLAQKVAAHIAGPDRPGRGDEREKPSRGTRG